MAEKRKNKQVLRRKEDLFEKPSKEDYAVAKHLRFNLPVKEGKLVGITVQYFIATKAIDSLLDSKFGSKAKSDPLFTSRASCVEFLDRLLQKKFFHRAAKIEKKKEKDSDKKRKKLKDTDCEDVNIDESKKDKRSKKSKEETKKDKDDVQDSSKEKEKDSDPDKEDKKDDEKRKKRKLKLEMHDNQVFKDGPEVYVWIYDPVPVKTFIIGLFLVLGAIGVCLFPLWPPEVRFGVYYISVAAAGFVGVILSLCIVRFVLFCIIWAVSMGRHHFWFLPNLTEDVGFFESFRPMYKHDYFGSVEIIEEKESNNEIIEESQNVENIPAENESNVVTQEVEESGSENDNGYEIVDKKEIETEETENDLKNEQNDNVTINSTNSIEIASELIDNNISDTDNSHEAKKYK